MNKTIIIGLILSVVLAGCGLSEEQYKSVAMKQIDSWTQLRYNQGISDGIKICESDYKPMLEQFEPREDCIKIIWDKYTMQSVCKDNSNYKVMSKIMSKEKKKESRVMNSTYIQQFGNKNISTKRVGCLLVRVIFGQCWENYKGERDCIIHEYGEPFIATQDYYELLNRQSGGMTEVLNESVSCDNAEYRYN